MPVTLLANALTTVERVKEQGSGIASSDPTQDEQIRFKINSITDRFMTYARREFKTAAPQTNGATGSMTAGSAVLTDTNANFQTTDVGKVIVVYGAGVLGMFFALQTTILSRQSTTQVTLATNAVNTVSAASYTYGSATRTFALGSDGYGGAFIDFQRFDAQAIGAVTLDTQGGATGTLLSASTPDYQPMWQNDDSGAYKGVDVYSTAATSYSTITPVGITRLVTVTGVWGWPAPALNAIEDACVEQVRSVLRESQVMRTPNFDASPTSAIEFRGALLPWVLRTLDMYRRMTVAV